MRPGDWDAYFIERAKHNATASHCRSRHVGAVAVRGRRSFADGFNGSLPGALHCDKGGCRRCASAEKASGFSLELCSCVHAEENIVTWCARTGTRLEGATIYSTDQPCTFCTRLLYSAGVIRVVYAEPYPQLIQLETPKMSIEQVTP